MRLTSTFILVLVFSFCYSQEVQWADYVVSFSSQLTPTIYSANQVVGNPNVPENEGDSPNAWAPKKDNKTEFIIVGYNEPMRIQQIAIHESFNPGAISEVHAIDEQEQVHILYKSEPRQLPRTSRILNIIIPLTEYKVKAIEVQIEGSQVEGLNCIDAIGISNSNRPITIKIPVVANANTNMEVNKLGANVNSDFDEAGPVVSPDGKYLFFSRFNHPGNVGGEDDPEDIWFAEWNESTESWGEAKNIGAPLNTKGSNYVNSAYNEGDQLVLLLANQYKSNGKKLRPGVSLSRSEGDSWSIPETVEIEDFFNYSPTSEYSLSPDGRILLMSIERDDTHGLDDLYVSFRNDSTGQWSAPLNLGEQVNTSHDEVSPLLLSDNRTLFFASAGFEGYGGNDIMTSTRLDDSWTNWSKPENMGPGVNTSADELQMSINEETKMGFFVRATEDAMDIYSFNSDDLFLPPKTSITADIVAIDAGTRDELSTVVSISKASGRGEYGTPWVSDSSINHSRKLDLGASYKISIKAKAYIEETLIVDVPADENTLDRVMRLSLQPLPAEEVAESIEVNDIEFKFNSFEVTTESASYIKSIIKKFNESKLTTIELSGHADNTGDEDYNMILSEKRVRTVARLITSEGVDENRLQIKWFGESLPKYPNDSPANRAKNRRVEVRIIK